MKLTVYIDSVNSNHEVITDPKEIAQLVKDHISHLGNVKIYYDIPYDQLSWWQKTLRIMGSGYK
jgi:hypothetical protein